MKKRKIIVIAILLCVSLQTFKIYATAKVDNLINNIFTNGIYDYTVTRTASKAEYGAVSIKPNTNSSKKSTVTVPELVRQTGYTYEVTRIEESAFADQKYLKKVYIPRSVRMIDENAFKGCTRLNTVYIPDTITRISVNAFSDCSPELKIYCFYESCAYYFAKSNHIKYQFITNTKTTSVDKKRKLIIVGDSRTHNMSNWVNTSVPTRFVAKSHMGFNWLMDEGIGKVNAVKKPGDVIVVWLGVNDYFSNSLGGDTWSVYANKLNSLANYEWADCKVYVAAVGYVDRAKHIAFYGKDIRSNVTQLASGNRIHGIEEFNKKLKASLSSKINWIDTYGVIGIPNNDTAVTPDNIWYTRENGKKDGLHYGIEKTQEIYNYFVKKSGVK